MLVPKDSPDGNYIFYVIVRFDGEIGTASEVFNVISTPKGFIELSTLYIYVIPGFFLIIIIFLILEYRHHHKRIIVRKHLIGKTIHDLNKFKFTKIKESTVHKKNLESRIKRLRQDHELGLISRTEYLKAAKKMEKIKGAIESRLRILKQNYELGLIPKVEYLKAKRRAEETLEKFV